jgi:hypothetical protein
MHAFAKVRFDKLGLIVPFVITGCLTSGCVGVGGAVDVDNPLYLQLGLGTVVNEDQFSQKGDIRRPAEAANF